MTVADWPPPSYVRDLVTGKQRRATEAELREANRLLAKHRDLARERPRIHPSRSDAGRAVGAEELVDDAALFAAGLYDDEGAPAA